MPTVIVTGGCGYIGSHSMISLVEAGYEVVSIDNYLRSQKPVLQRIEQITGTEVSNYEVDLRNLNETRNVFREVGDVEGVIHFAALKTVPESVNNPLLYYENNLDSLINILYCVREFEVPSVVFSSSCSVYGEAPELPVTEETPLGTLKSPYGKTKKMGEDILEDFTRAHPIKGLSLRYFNPVGAHPSAYIGEVPHGPPENLVPIITRTALGLREKLTVYGKDYNTRDGTCIRDYIHVMDIAEAHTQALQHLSGRQPGKEGYYDVINLGTGRGSTVLEVIEAFEKATGKALDYEIGDRRPGDVEAVYADNQKARQQLGWTPQYNLREMMRTAYQWEKELQKEDSPFRVESIE